MAVFFFVDCISMNALLKEKLPDQDSDESGGRVWGLFGI